MLALVVGGTGVVIWGALCWDWPILFAAVAGAVSLWFTVAASTALCDLDSLDGVRIVPYFERDIPGPDTFFRSGGALARNCRFLDDVVSESGLAPLTAFGFVDDFWRRRAPWYEAVDGLLTVSALRAKVSDCPRLVDEPEAVVADLEHVEARLEEAARLGVRFCLHLRRDRAYTGEEFARSRGKY
jgi:hypothetical protein